MKNLVALAVSAGNLLAQAGLLTVTGTFQAPDGTPFNGTAQIQLVRPTSTIRDICASPAQVVNFRSVFVRIVAGAFSQNLYQTGCLSPSQPYSVVITDTMRTQISRQRWIIGGTGGTGAAWQELLKSFATNGGHWNDQNTVGTAGIQILPPLP